jgi:ABC-2 type transport system ATP-binding protein
MIEVNNLVKIYRKGGPRVVDDVSFTVPKGTVLGLLGPNGAGKTTTVKMLLGLVLPNSGHMHIAGLDISYGDSKSSGGTGNFASNRNHRDVLRSIGAILEGARNIYWRLSARNNLEYFGLLRGMSGEYRKHRIEEVLQLVGLKDRADEETRHFSRGMQQKVALAVAILHEPSILLLDEPTLGLDVQSSRTIEKTVREMAGNGKSVILTTHQMALAQRVCDHIFVIHKGKQIAYGPTKEIISQVGGEQQTVEVVVEGFVDEQILQELTDTVPDLKVETQNGRTVLSWITLEDESQKDLVSTLNLLVELDISIVNAGRREATLEEVFVQLTSEDGEPE